MKLAIKSPFFSVESKITPSKIEVFELSAEAIK